MTFLCCTVGMTRRYINKKIGISSDLSSLSQLGRKKSCWAEICYCYSCRKQKTIDDEIKAKKLAKKKAEDAERARIQRYELEEQYWYLMSPSKLTYGGMQPNFATWQLGPWTKKNGRQRRTDWMEHGKDWDRTDRNHVKTCPAYHASEGRWGGKEEWKQPLYLYNVFCSNFQFFLMRDLNKFNSIQFKVKPGP